MSKIILSQDNIILNKLDLSFKFTLVFDDYLLTLLKNVITFFSKPCFSKWGLTAKIKLNKTGMFVLLKYFKNYYQLYLPRSAFEEFSIDEDFAFKVESSSLKIVLKKIKSKNSKLRRIRFFYVNKSNLLTFEILKSRSRKSKKIKSKKGKSKLPDYIYKKSYSLHLDDSNILKVLGSYFFNDECEAYLEIDSDLIKQIVQDLNVYKDEKFSIKILGELIIICSPHYEFSAKKSDFKLTSSNSTFDLSYSSLDFFYIYNDKDLTFNSSPSVLSMGEKLGISFKFDYDCVFNCVLSDSNIVQENNSEPFDFLKVRDRGSKLKKIKQKKEKIENKEDPPLKSLVIKRDLPKGVSDINKFLVFFKDYSKRISPSKKGQRHFTRGLSTTHSKVFDKAEKSRKKEAAERKKANRSKRKILREEEKNPNFFAKL